MHIRVNDLNLLVEQRGAGIPLLFIHGYPLSSRIWLPQLEGLSKFARTIALDLRGHGESDVAEGPYEMDLLAEDCCAVLDALGIDQPVVVCGLSMGGYVTFAFYRKYPERVAGLILSATRAGEDSPEAKANRDRAASLAQEQGSGAVAESMLPKMLSPKTYSNRQELVHQVWDIMQATSVQGIVGDLMGMKSRPNSVPTLAKIDKPTLILHGSDDQLIPLSEAVAMRTAIQGASLRVMPDAGHLLNMEQPDPFNQAIRAFIQELSV